MKAGAEEESLQSAIKGGNADRITKAIEALPAAPKTAMSMIEGDWQAGGLAATGTTGTCKEPMRKHELTALVHSSYAQTR